MRTIWRFVCATTGSSDYADDPPSSEQLGSVFQGVGDSQKEEAKNVIQDALDKRQGRVFSNILQPLKPTVRKLGGHS